MKSKSPLKLVEMTDCVLGGTDNTGAYPDLVHPDTIKDVSEHFPRHAWSQCFASTIHRENGLKPWAHTTTLGEEAFPAKVLGNKLMEPFE